MWHKLTKFQIATNNVFYMSDHIKQLPLKIIVTQFLCAKYFLFVWQTKIVS